MADVPALICLSAAEIATFRSRVEQTIEDLIDLLDAIDASDEDKEADVDGELEVDGCEAGDDAPVATRRRYLCHEYEDDEEELGV